jgi:hypothetical protein
MARLLAVLRRVRTRLRAVVGFSLVFGVLEAALVAPLGAFLLRLFLSRSGRASAGNFEIAVFLLSVSGALALVVVGAVIVAGVLYVAGLLRIWGPPATVGRRSAGLLRTGNGCCASGAPTRRGRAGGGAVRAGMLLAVKRDGAIAT